MTKLEVDRPELLQRWLAVPEPAVFQAQDLREPAVAQAIQRYPRLCECAFFGCQMPPDLAAEAARVGCLLFPPTTDTLFGPYRTSLYTPGELFAGFDPADPETRKATLDYRIYDTVAVASDPAHPVRHANLDEVLLRRLHDAHISDALFDYLHEATTGGEIRMKRAVGIMGGHDARRDSDAYTGAARLTRQLGRNGYLTVTGGGPGLMEAANLGAYSAGFADGALERVLEAFRTTDAQDYKSALWLSAGYEAWQAMGAPTDAAAAASIGIPTWHYGHEPPNVFATHIAKYFENSVREEGLLHVGMAGVVFFSGNAGTVQEIFQDANQNYYRVYEGYKSPMILFGTEYWNPGESSPAPNPDKRKPAYPLLRKLAKEKGFEDYLLLTDSLEEVLAFLEAHPPKKG